MRFFDPTGLISLADLGLSTATTGLSSKELNEIQIDKPNSSAPKPPTPPSTSANPADFRRLEEELSKVSSGMPHDPTPELPNDGPSTEESVDLEPSNRYFYSEGIWNQPTNLKEELGQVVWITVRNPNVLGTTIEITPEYGDVQAAVILPFSNMQFKFGVYAEEPVPWKFKISTYSDAFIVGYVIESTWVPGMPSNPEK